MVTTLMKLNYIHTGIICIIQEFGTAVSKNKVFEWSFIKFAINCLFQYLADNTGGVNA